MASLLSKIFVSRKDSKEDIKVSSSVSFTQNIQFPNELLIAVSEGLLPGEVILLFWLENKTAEERIPIYFKDYYLIKVNSAKQKLLAKNLVTYGISENSLNALKVEELKSILRQYTLSTTGKKNELINRVVSNIPLSKLSLKKTYSLSDSGKQITKKYSQFIKAHRDKDITLDQFLNVSRRFPEYMDYNKIKWIYFSEEEMRNLNDSNYSLFGMAKRRKYQIMLEKNEYQKALVEYMVMVMIDFSGLYNSMEEYLKPVYLPTRYGRDHQPVLLLIQNLTQEEINKAFESAKIEFQRIKHPSFIGGKELKLLLEAFNTGDFTKIESHMKKYENYTTVI